MSLTKSYTYVLRMSSVVTAVHTCSETAQNLELGSPRSSAFQLLVCHLFCKAWRIHSQLSAKVSLRLLLPHNVMHTLPNLPWMAEQVLRSSKSVNAWRITEPLSCLTPVRVVTNSIDTLWTVRIVSLCPDTKDYVLATFHAERVSG